ncbi:MAG TPA: hypothetical protein VGV18_08055 [Verrucomicrobiae bacterium]|nr:hypothetical protein [Verrucomicrobiae bacterium]
MKPKIKQLSIEDARYLRAAEGWLELGDAASATSELEQIKPVERTHPAVLQVRYGIHAKCGHWDRAAEMAEQIASALPDEAGSWINLAYATRRKTGGGIPAAKTILLAAEPIFSQECIIPFNLACYCSQLREFEQAQQWLRKAAAINDKAVRKLAAEDEDLKPLWESKGKMIWGEDNPLR